MMERVTMIQLTFIVAPVPMVSRQVETVVGDIIENIAFLGGLHYFIVRITTLFTLNSPWPFLLQGQDCDVPIHACISNPCKHGGTCHLKEGDKDGFW